MPRSVVVGPLIGTRISVVAYRVPITLPTEG
jgi:hypothetical protein